MKIKRNYIIICVFFSMLLTIAIGATRFIEYKSSEISIIATSEKNNLSEGNKIQLNDIWVDDYKIGIDQIENIEKTGSY